MLLKTCHAKRYRKYTIVMNKLNKSVRQLNRISIEFFLYIKIQRWFASNFGVNREFFYHKFRIIQISQNLNKICTCAGTAINPTDTPQITLPIRMEVTLFDKPMTNHPMHRGITDNWRLPRRPIASRSGPDKSEPIGVARLWTEAAIQTIHHFNNYVDPRFKEIQILSHVLSSNIFLNNPDFSTL